MEKGFQSGIFKTVKKMRHHPFLLTPLHFTENLILSLFANFGRPLRTPLIRKLSDYQTEIKILWSVKMFFSEIEEVMPKFVIADYYC